MEQVLTAAFDSPAIMATTALESTPPERKAPSGTSEIIRSLIDSSRRWLSSAQASVSLIGLSRVKLMSQYSRGSLTGWPRFKRRVWAGDSFLACLKMERGSAT